MNKKVKLLLVIAVALVIAAVAGRYLGQSSAKEALARIEMIWPGFMEMPEQDRAFIGGLAMTCRLSKVDLDRKEVLACLRSAADDPKALLPKGFKSEDAPAILEALIPN